MSEGPPADRTGEPGAVGSLYLVLSVAAGIMVAAMMFITTIDVAGRYLFNRPLFAAFEITEILMGLLIFAGLPLATAARENIEISILVDNLSPRMRSVQMRLFEIVCGAVCFVMAWRMWVYGERLWRTGDRTLELQISIGLLAQIMACLLVVSGIAFTINALRGRGSLPASGGMIE